MDTSVRGSPFFPGILILAPCELGKEDGNVEVRNQSHGHYNFGSVIAHLPYLPAKDANFGEAL